MSKTGFMRVRPPSTGLQTGAHLLWQGRKVWHPVSCGPLPVLGKGYVSCSTQAKRRRAFDCFVATKSTKSREISLGTMCSNDPLQSALSRKAHTPVLASPTIGSTARRSLAP